VINRATKEAKRSSFKQPLGAVVVKGGRVVGIGHNDIRFSQRNTSTRYIQSMHAEVAALLAAGKNASRSIIFVSRITKDGQLAMAKPCSFCMKFMKELNVKRVVYSAGPNTLVEENL
jgi:tRNA(Arg) A34 adenosine deaminase TadA